VTFGQLRGDALRMWTAALGVEQAAQGAFARDLLFEHIRRLREILLASAKFRPQLNVLPRRRRDCVRDPIEPCGERRGFGLLRLARLTLPVQEDGDLAVRSLSFAQNLLDTFVLADDSVRTAGDNVLQDDREKTVEVIGIAVVLFDRFTRFTEPVKPRLDSVGGFGGFDAIVLLD
jgi:hypothetical protein